MKSIYKLGFVIFLCTCFSFTVVDWGFFGHRKINRMAVFTLPQEMLGFYKKNIHFITEHAVDPDKRRYAMKGEAGRHYIDIDHWDTFPFDKVPRDIKTAIMTHGMLLCINDVDTVDVTADVFQDLEDDFTDDFYHQYLRDDRYSPEIMLELDPASKPDFLLSSRRCQELIFKNPFVEYGVLPYFLEDFYKRLIWAYENKDKKSILKISAEMGHYIGDAHVPLHTTENYNGQLTNQLGIHAFWESRIPELFADQDYDMLVGKANYIPNTSQYFWSIILESHELLPEVLAKEKYVKETFAQDKQFCFDERLERSTWTQCPDYAAAYQNELGGTIEKRMQGAILALGNVWYSAWVDAGQPDLSTIDNNLDPEKLKAEKEELDKAVEGSNIMGRSHGK